MLAKSKLNSIKTLISPALIDMEISHEEFVAIFKEKDKYEKLKENVRNISERSSAEKQKNIETKQCKFKDLDNKWVVDNLPN